MLSAISAAACATGVLVYGTQREAGANRYAAEQLQAAYINQFERSGPHLQDFEVTDDLLSHKDVIFVGRPEANTALARGPSLSVWTIRAPSSRSTASPMQASVKP